MRPGQDLPQARGHERQVHQCINPESRQHIKHHNRHYRQPSFYLSCIQHCTMALPQGTIPLHVGIEPPCMNISSCMYLLWNVNRRKPGFAVSLSLLAISVQWLKENKLFYIFYSLCCDQLHIIVYPVHRRKIRLIESYAKCRYLQKLTGKGVLSV